MFLCVKERFSSTSRAGEKSFLLAAVDEACRFLLPYYSIFGSCGKAGVYWANPYLGLGLGFLFWILAPKLSGVSGRLPKTFVVLSSKFELRRMLQQPLASFHLGQGRDTRVAFVPPGQRAQVQRRPHKLALQWRMNRMGSGEPRLGTVARLA